MPQHQFDAGVFPECVWAISITNERPALGLKQFGEERGLHLAFHDVSYNELDIDREGADWWLNKVTETRFLAEQARAIHTFVAKWWDSDAGELVIHCHRGESRSAAVAKWVAQSTGAMLDQHPARANEMVFRMLEEPDCFDRYAEVSQPEEEPEPPVHWAKRIWDFIF